MFKLAIVGTVAAYAAAKQHPINEDIVKEIRAKATTWTAHDPAFNPLRHHTAEHIQGLLGDKGMPSGNSYIKYATQDVITTPESFDSRATFGDCVHPIRDQQRCG